jgi:hypothetical protein
VGRGASTVNTHLRSRLNTRALVHACFSLGHLVLIDTDSYGHVDGGDGGLVRSMAQAERDTFTQLSAVGVPWALRAGQARQDLDSHSFCAGIYMHMLG